MAVEKTPLLGLTKWTDPGYQDPVHVDQFNDDADAVEEFLGRGGFHHDVRAYGAVGNGVADDTAALQAALEAAAGGGTVGFNRPLLITAPIDLPAGVALRGTGPAAELIFNWTAEATGPYFRNSVMDGTGVGYQLLDFTVTGAGAGTPSGLAGGAAGIRLRRVSDVKIRGLRLVNVPGICIAIQGCQDVEVTGNVIDHPGRDGITCWWYTDPLRNVHIHHNTVIEAGDDLIAVHASPSDQPNTVARPSDFSIIGNILSGFKGVSADNAGRGIIVQGGEDFVIQGNVIDTTFSSGIAINGDNIAGSSGFTSRRFVLGPNVVIDAGQTGDESQPRLGIRVMNVEDAVVHPQTVINPFGFPLYVEPATRVKVYHQGTGSPEGVVTAPVGSEYTRLDGGTGSTFYVKQSGAGTTGWRAMAAADAANVWTLDQTISGRDLIFDTTGRGVMMPDASAVLRRVLASSGPNFSVGSPSIASVSLAAAAAVIFGSNAGVEVARMGTGGLRISTAKTIEFQQANQKLHAGAGSPEGAVVSNPGSLYLRSDGGAGTTLYVKETGVGNTGWVAK